MNTHSAIKGLPHHGWVPISERNPKRSGSFPVIEGGDLGKWATGYFDVDKNQWFDPENTTDRLDVTFWFPLIRPDEEKL